MYTAFSTHTSPPAPPDMFERTLQDLIRGLRAHKASSKAQEDAFLQEAMVEIREELKGKDMNLKAEGVLKMCYLMMLYPLPSPPGFAFHVVEVMSSPKYHLKQLGYLASPMAFSGDTEEIVLTINGMKKDLLSPHAPLPPLALSALPHLLTLSPSLAVALHADLLHLLTHSSARIRKRAILCLLPCWESNPEGLREGFPRIRERLLDDDQGVVGATVGVVMELARRQGGKNYLPLAPDLFGILTGSSNNWMLIKVVKLFAILTPLEPRLVRKLLPPITALISSTSAISLLYECVRTCIVGGMLDPDRAEGEALARVCVEKLGGYLRDEGGDQNLRYIALLAMVKIIPTQPQMVAEYQEEILQSLDDPDVSIRIRALELVSSMVDRDNMQSIVDRLLAHLAPPTTSTALPSAAASLAAVGQTAKGSQSTDPSTTSASITLSPAYRLLIAQKILSVISLDTYVNVSDFEWVVSVLVDVAYVSNVNVGAGVKSLLLDVVGRVRSVRGFAVDVLEKALDDEHLIEKSRESGAEAGLVEAAVWICGEYASELSSPLSAISAILSPTLHQSDTAMVALSLQAVVKIFARHAAAVSTSWSEEKHQELQNLVASVKQGLQPFTKASDIEIQERAVESTQLLSFIEADLKNHKAPVSSQKKEAAIEGLEGGFEESTPNGGSDDNPPYPKSLFLLEPLYTSYELNAVAAQAQSSIRVPDGLDLDTEYVPSGGFGDIAELADAESEVEEEVTQLGEGGGKGMEELRRVLREQEAEDREKRKGKKNKGKSKKAEGELTAEEREAKEKRKAERRARAKDDPYYLYDEKDEKNGNEDDIDDIPIVRLDISDLPPDEQVIDEKPKSRVKKGKADVIDLDRSGEMPTDAKPPALNGSATADPVVKSGLAAVDLTSAQPSRASSTARFDEYKLDEEEDSRSTPQPPTDVAAASGDIEVVRVKRKKKKDGEKKKKVSAA